MMLRFLGLSACSIFLAVGLAGCNGKLANLDAPPKAPEGEVASATVIVLERAECPSGSCKVYRSTLFGNGEIVVDSARAPRKRLHGQGSDVIALADELEQKTIFDIPEQQSCDSLKQPVTISITHHGKTRVVHHTMGCPPEELEQMVTRIDTVAVSNKWAH